MARLIEATTYHGKKGKFCKRDSAHTVTKDGARYKVVRQHRRMAVSRRQKAEELVQRLSVAKQRAALTGALSAPGWINLHDIVDDQPALDEEKIAVGRQRKI